MIFKQAFRWAFIALIWKQYKASIVSTLLLIAYLFIVNAAHKDYITALGPDSTTPLSFVYKWLAFTVGVVLYFGFHIIRGRLKPKKKSTQDKIAKSKKLTDTDEDPFAAIRSRDKLRSRSDFLMNDKDKNNN